MSFDSATSGEEESALVNSWVFSGARCSLPRSEEERRVVESNPLSLSHGVPVRRRNGTTETDLPVRLREAVNNEVGEAAMMRHPPSLSRPGESSGRFMFAHRGEREHEQGRRGDGALLNPPAGQGTRERPCNACQRRELGRREAYQPGSWQLGDLFKRQAAKSSTMKGGAPVPRGPGLPLAGKNREGRCRTAKATVRWVREELLLSAP